MGVCVGGVDGVRVQDLGFRAVAFTPFGSEGASHLEFVSNGQGGSKHVTLIQNHSQPMYLHLPVQ